MSGQRSYSHLVTHYDRLAQRYDRRWRAYLGQTLEPALGALRLCGTERILDVGCGTGEFERTAMSRFPQLAIVGIDVAPGMIAIARRKLVGVSQVSFQVAQAETLPFGQDAFDVVICANVLHHVREPRQALQECARVLRPHGQFVLVDWCRDFWHCRLVHGWLRLFDRTYVKMHRVVEVSSALDELCLVMGRARRFIVRPCYGMMWLIAEKIDTKDSAA